MTFEVLCRQSLTLSSRLGKNNQHTGNDQLRAMARQECANYRISSKKGKSYISRELVRMVREMDPPGRFLKKNSTTGLWEDVGDDVAREKASQALRDAVAFLQAEEEEQQQQDEDQSRKPPAVPSSQAFRRSSSAPPIMDKSPNDERRKTWPVQQQQQQRHHHDNTPDHYPSVTPASVTSAAKRRRYSDHATSPWMYQPENPPYASPEFASSRSNPEFSSHQYYPTQHARRDYHPQRYPHQPGALLGEVDDGDLHEFDLFNGKLLEPGEEETSLERRSDTF